MIVSYRIVSLSNRIDLDGRTGSSWKLIEVGVNRIRNLKWNSGLGIEDGGI